MKKYLIYIFWAVITLGLLYLSLGYNDSTSSILAQVEPQKYAVSFQKAVRIKEIYVIPGQQVKKGDELIKVERPDLLLDVENKANRLKGLKSQLQINGIEKANQLSMARLVFQQNIAKIDTDLERLELILTSQEGMSKNLSAMNLWGDSTNFTDKNYMSLRVELLEKEKISLSKQYRLKIQEIEQIHEIDLLNLNREVTLVENELKVLSQEEKELVQYANRNGTVGNVYAETDELVPPYTTLISVYDSNPTIIRALINEQQNSGLQGGDNVIVESTNRKYRISGEVLEIGSRIIEYPNRLRTFQEVPVYGREIFIRIPEESNFLNGEKVFVKLGK
ncbi:MAG: HlyD family efflux transporter periplasmic adaptor subunit [Reichenbachiella sp.]